MNNDAIIFTHLSQRTDLAPRLPGFANFPAMGNDVEMQRIIDLRRRERFENFVRLFSRRARRNPAQPLGDTKDVRVDGKRRLAEREQQDNRSGLGPDALELKQVGFRIFHRHRAQEFERERAAFLRELAQDRSNARRFRVAQARRTDRADDGARRRVAHRFPSWKFRTQIRVRAVGIYVRRVLGQNRRDQLRQRIAAATALGFAVLLNKSMMRVDDPAAKYSCLHANWPPNDKVDLGVCEREKHLALVRRLEQKLETDRARQVAKKGTYGIHERCGKPIGPARLEALPETTLCIKCKNDLEQGARRARM